MSNHMKITKNGGENNNDVLVQLQKTVAALRSKSRNIMRRHSELHDCIQKFTLGSERRHSGLQVPSVNHRNSTDSNGLPRKDSFEPIIHYSQLSSEDKQTMKDILMLQEWLLMIKREKTFDKFRSTIVDLKERIFKPLQARQMRARVASSQAPGPPSLGLDVEEADELDTDEVFEKAQAHLAKQELEEKEHENDPQIPDGVVFQNGRWVQVAGEVDETFDALDDISDNDFLEDDNDDGDSDSENELDDIEEDWDAELELEENNQHNQSVADENALDDLDVPENFKGPDPTPTGVKSIPRHTRPRSKAFSSKTMPARNRAKSTPVKYSASAGPSKRISKAKESWTSTSQTHAEQFGSVMQNVTADLYDPTKAFSDKDHVAWIHHQSDLFTAFDSLIKLTSQS